jgi:putative sigma-54 modulation protein
MKIDVQGSKHFVISDRIRAYIKKRVSKFEYFASHLGEVVFHIDQEKYIHIVEATVPVNKLGVHHFKADAREVYTAIDKVIHKIDIKINKDKKKLQNHHHAGHEEVVNFFTHHEEDKPEPTREFSIIQKPTPLDEALLQIKETDKDCFGFVLLQEGSQPTPAFLRRLDGDVLYFYGPSGQDSYAEYDVSSGTTEDLDQVRLREFNLKRTSLLGAQRSVLEDEHHFQVFENSDTEKVSFLLKEGHGKWNLFA